MVAACRCIHFGSAVGARNPTACAYPVQRGAEALYSADGRKQIGILIDHYMGNAKLLRDAAAHAGLEAFGGVNAPYIWVKTPDGCHKLGNVRPDVAPAECGNNTGSGFWRARRRLLSHIRVQQPREC